MDTSSERGQVLILAAVSMSMLAAVLALLFTVSSAYDRRSELGAVADAAARSAAIEIHRGNAGAALAFAQAEVNRAIADGRLPATAGFISPNGAQTCDLSTTPCAYPTNQFYEVILEARSPGWFGFAEMTPRARAVAGSGPGPNCITILDRPPVESLIPPGVSVSIGGPGGGAGATRINMPNCDLATNGDLSVGMGAMVTVNVHDAEVAGTCSGSCGAVNNLTQGVPPSTDPLATLAAPTNPYATCTSVTVPNMTAATIAPGCYTFIKIGNNAPVTFAPGGLYWLTGAFTTGNSPDIHGTGVMFVLAGTAGPSNPCDPGTMVAGCINIPNAGTVQLSAQTSGPYTGILFYQPSSNQTAASFNNAGSYNLSGAMYFPSASVSYGNAGTTNDCTLLVARSVAIGGGSTNFSNTCAAYGGSPILTVNVSE